MLGYIGPMTDALINQITVELKKKENKDKIMNNIIDPLLCDITARYYSHFLTGTVVLIIIVVLLLTIIFLNFYGNKSIRAITHNDILCTNCTKGIKS
jgi:hypothetical protein